MPGRGRPVVKMYRRRHPLDPWLIPQRVERAFTQEIRPSAAFEDVLNGRAFVPELGPP